MKLSRLVGLIFAAVLAVNLVAVAMASASAPEFNPGTATALTTKTGTALLETASTSPVSCKESVTTGGITGVKTVGNLKVTFTGCSSTEKTGCSVKGGGGGTGTIITSTLDGELGTVSTTEAASGVGLLLLPTTGTVFVTIEGTCLIASPSPVDGSVAGEASPISVKSTTGKLVLTGSKGVQAIKSINILGATVEPKLKALGLLASSESATGEVKYATAVEVS
jgi:hypothetical protein